MRSRNLQNTSDQNRTIINRFSRQAAQYNAHTALQKHVADALAAQMPDLEKPKILEVGCGTGHLTEHLLRRYPFGDFLLTDLSEKMLTQCRLRFPQCGQKRFQILNGEWPDQTETFDIIASSMAIHWFDNPLIALERLSNQLSPGGTLYYSALGGKSFSEWREFCIQQNIPSGILNVPQWPGIIAEEQHTSKFDTTLAFFQTMKAMGASTPRADYRPLSAGTLRKAFKRFDANKGNGITWHIVYGKLSA